jgi:hypothetical protein
MYIYISISKSLLAINLYLWIKIGLLQSFGRLSNLYIYIPCNEKWQLSFRLEDFPACRMFGYTLGDQPTRMGILMVT